MHFTCPSYGKTQTYVYVCLWVEKRGWKNKKINKNLKLYILETVIRASHVL